ncbi:hypothetical protein IM697_22655 [Streptomyces ferrugineus]|uniref:Uncharacterized protein n=1 Tax=Streptomyces ferrugineus TaxID=1413221 RepID=A0A7M2SZI3_9ACTN|nr:hypothetical protein [Streptomyces ferrugineus]QOV40928.1 hypothetical protein IM697_22655 [Streptomyces ferrugineus]
MIEVQAPAHRIRFFVSANPEASVAADVVGGHDRVEEGEAAQQAAAAPCSGLEVARPLPRVPALLEGEFFLGPVVGALPHRLPGEFGEDGVESFDLRPLPCAGGQTGQPCRCRPAGLVDLDAVLRALPDPDAGHAVHVAAGLVRGKDRAEDLVRPSLALHLEFDAVDAGAYSGDPEGVGGEVAAGVEDLVEEVRLEAELLSCGRGDRWLVGA